MVICGLPALDELRIERMASGHACLQLTSRVSWERFPSFARTFVDAVKAQPLEQLDAADIRVIKVALHGAKLLLTYDDFPVMVALESQDALGDAVLAKLHESLLS